MDHRLSLNWAPKEDSKSLGGPASHTPSLRLSRHAQCRNGTRSSRDAKSNAPKHTRLKWFRARKYLAVGHGHWRRMAPHRLCPVAFVIPSHCAGALTGCCRPMEPPFQTYVAAAPLKSSHAMERWKTKALGTCFESGGSDVTCATCSSN
jgi:hypothetical protein